MDFNYVAIETFARVHQDPNRYLFIRGPVGSGKSSGCIWHCVLNALEQDPQWDGVRRSRYGIIRASYPALKSTVIKSWKSWFKLFVNIVYDVPIRGELRLPHPDGETEVEIELVFIALDREEDVNKLQSLELTGCHINELAEIPSGVHQMLKSRVNRYPEMEFGGAKKPFIVGDYNSVPTDHWLYKLAEETKPLKHSFYVQPPALLVVPQGKGNIQDAAGNCYIINPDADNLGHWQPGNRGEPPNAKSTWSFTRKEWWVPHLDEDYYTDMVLGADPDWVNVLVLNNYGELRSGKPVFPEYLDSIHYDEKLLKPMDGIPITIGVDLGLTPAALFTQLTPVGKFTAFDEIVTEDCSVHKFLNDFLRPHIINNYPKHSVTLVLDPAGMTRSQNDAKAAYELVRDSGLPYIFAPTNNIAKRREAVVFFLRKLGGFAVGPKCPYYRKGMISEYKYEKRRLALANIRGSQMESFKEKPEKNIFSHINDAGQYAALELSEGRSFKKKKNKFESTNYKPASNAGY